MLTAAEHRQPESTTDALAHVVLQLRDEAIAQAGRNAALQAELDRERAARSDAEARHAAEIARLRQEHTELLAAIDSAHVQALSDLGHQYTESTTWGAGRALLAPVRLVKRIGGRGR